MDKEEPKETSGNSIVDNAPTTPGMENGVRSPISAQNDKANQLFEELNKLIAPRKMAWVNPQTDCILLEKNAHFMPKEMLVRLTENVKKDKFLSQIPFAIKLTGKFRFHIISGNHRMKAAVKAGLERELVMYLDEEDCSKEKGIAIQLSHNSIKGDDDKDILLEIYKELTDLNLKEYTGLNENELYENDYKQFPAINEELFDMTELRFMFTPASLENIDKVLDALEQRTFASENDRLVLINFEKFVATMTKVKIRSNIKNNTTAFLKMIEICEKELAKPTDRGAGKVAEQGNNGALPTK